MSGAWLAWAILGALALALVALGLGIALVRAMRRFERRLGSGLTPIDRDLRVLGVALARAEDRLGRLERETGRLKEACEHPGQGAGGAHFGQAIALVRRGWRVEDLVSTCGLSRGEAELVYSLHRPKDFNYSEKTSN